MVRKGKLLLDGLKSDYSEDLAIPYRREGMCLQLSGVMCSLSGILVLVSSFLLLRTKNLQAYEYWNPNSPLYLHPFPSLLLGCAATNMAGTFLQILSSLMFLFQDITLNAWKWINFTVIMISTTSLLLLQNEDHSDITVYPLYKAFLIVNDIVCSFFLITTCTCCCATRKI